MTQRHQLRNNQNIFIVYCRLAFEAGTWTPGVSLLAARELIQRQTRKGCGAAEGLLSRRRIYCAKSIFAATELRFYRSRWPWSRLAGRPCMSQSLCPPQMEEAWDFVHWMA